jgi:predicted unusual protein kinase regulating ubiquinone biosynthesis (AarF/ABC1/UbiB family)
MPAKFELDRYDANAIANHYKRLPLKVWGRCLNIFLPLLTLFFSLWWDLKTQQSDRKSKQRAIQTRKLLTKLGPAFIKIGQALSTRPDVVPASFMDEFAQLQDQLPPFPNEQAFRFIQEELGATPLEIYAEFSPNPIAAASLGQVYKGRLRTGEQVAIKVQRPDINEAIALDMYILRGIASWAMQNFKFIHSNLVGILEEFASRIFEEMDYTCEGANADRFAEYYGKIEEIYVPKIYWKYTARRVLTMEWIEGTKLTELEKIKSMGLDSRHIIEVGVQCSLRQLLDQGFFHADPHPGNLLVMNDGRLAYLDFGMMSQVNSEQRYGLIEAIIHLVNRDYAALSKDYVKLGFLTSTVNLDQITPALAKVFNEALGASVAELDFKEMTDQLSKIMYDYPFQVPAYYALIIRSLVTLEGIALNVDPNFKVLSVAYPYVANRLLTDSNPELRNSLKDLLFSDGEFRWTRLENLLKNAKSNQDYDLKETLHQVSDFLLSSRGEYMRDRLTDEIVKGIEKEAFSRITNPFAQRKPQVKTNRTDPSSLQKLMGVWSTISQDQNLQPLEFVPLAGQILAKPETQEIGRNIVWQLTQRAIARLIREVALPKESPDLIPEVTITNSQLNSLVNSTVASSPSRQLNGKTW